MSFEKKQSSAKLMRTLFRWLTLGLLFASTHALAQSTGTVTYVYTDPQGTPLAETDASGNITATFEYTPYGTYAPQGTSTPGPTPNGPGYTGHVNDPETNLVYMQARYYDTATGRFLSIDPQSVDEGDTFDFNRYDYASNNPVNHVDPNGHCAPCAVVAGVAGSMLVGAGIGAGIDYGVQKLFHPNQPVNMNEVKVAAALGAVSAGGGAVTMALVRVGALSVTKAVAANVVVNTVAGGAGRAIQGKMDNKPATAGQIAISAAGNGIGTLFGNAVGLQLGDFSEASTQGMAARMESASINSPAGIGSSIVNTTAPVGIGMKQSTQQAAGSTAGQAVAQSAVSVGQEAVSQKAETNQ